MALNGSATQSSDNGAAIASRAIDGNTGVYSRTYNDNQAWWQVDFGSMSSISWIKVWNKSAAFMSRLSDYYVLVSTEPMNPTDTLDALLVRSDVNVIHEPGVAGFPSRYDFEETVLGRYVRIQVDRTEYLYFGEVEVLVTQNRLFNPIFLSRLPYNSNRSAEKILHTISGL